MKTEYKIASQQLESEAADAIEELQAENAQLRDQNTEPAHISDITWKKAID